MSGFTPALIGIGAVLAVAACVWLVARGAVRARRFLRRLARSQRLAARRHDRSSARNVGPAPGRPLPATHGYAPTAPIEKAVVLDAERRASEILADAERTREAARREAASMQAEAVRAASAIVDEAKRRAAEILAAAERERRVADEKRGEFSELLMNLLGEVRRGAGKPAGS